MRILVSGNLLNELPLILLPAILLIRTVILLIYELRHGTRITSKSNTEERAETE